MGHARGARSALALVVLVGCAAPSLGAPIPSKASADPAAVDSSESARAAVEAFLAREDVARALAERGLGAEEVERRVAQLSEEDLTVLADNLDTLQAAGAVPKYIWILLAILMAVTILATVF